MGPIVRWYSLLLWDCDQVVAASGDGTLSRGLVDMLGWLI